MKDKKVKYRYLDVARGLALLLVMVSHAHGLNKFLIYYYIQVFFVISGYTYCKGRYNYKEIIQKKAKRLLIPYFGYSALLWIFYAIIRRNGAMMLKSLFGIIYSRFCLYKTTLDIENVYLLDIANGAMWYLTAFFMTSLLFYLVADKCLSDWKACVVVVGILLTLTGLLNELHILLPWSIDIMGIATVLMLFGAFLRKYDFFEQPFSVKKVGEIFILYMCTVELNGRLNMSIREYGRFGTLSIPFFLIISMTGSILCIWFSKWIQNTVIGSFLSCLGTHTIELMCIHMVILEVFEVILGKFIDLKNFTGVVEWIYVIVRVAVAIIVALIVGEVVAQIKERCVLRKWKKEGEILD
ncbi:MAG: acyltransferase family protein [Roseburia inulinivorans]